MNINGIAEIFYFAGGGAGTLFFLLFFIYSLIEKKYRAAALSISFSFLIAAIWALLYYFFNRNLLIIIISSIIPFMFILLFFVPYRKRKNALIYEPNEKADERDTIFARAKYHEGTSLYEEYYSRKPEYKNIDDKIRKLPDLLAPEGKYYEPLKSEYVKSLFVIEEQNVRFVDGPVNEDRKEASPEEFSKRLKNYALHLGASEAGIARLNPFYVYSNVGLGPEPYGSEIVNNHKFVIAYTLEMDWKHVEKAPHIEITEETANQYLNAQKISISLAQYIRDLGYSARAHISGSAYQIMLPPVAYDAGLGEMSRMGYLISLKHGARVRLGAVTTDIPLIPDKPKNFGVEEFCEICKKCSDNCPSGSIPKHGRESVRGVEKWRIDIEKCYQYWRIVGTDCGLCMRACPFSHPDTFVHKALKVGVKNSQFARLLSARGDSIFYGKILKF